MGVRKKTKRTFRKLNPRGKKKRAPNLNPRRRIVLQEVAKGKSVQEAGRIAGYAQPQNASRAIQQMRPQILAAMEKLGWGIEKFAQHQVKLLNAKKTTYAQQNGIFTDHRTTDDNAIQLGAQDLSYKILGVYAPVNVEVSGTITHELTQQEKQEAIECVARILEYEEKERIRS